jgi:hypothetical protein
MPALLTMITQAELEKRFAKFNPPDEMTLFQAQQVSMIDRATLRPLFKRFCEETNQPEGLRVAKAGFHGAYKAVMITKQQLKSSTPFTYKSIKYTVKSASDGEYFVSGPIGYEGNILKIGTKSFTMYTFVMGKQVKIKVNYYECEPVIAE